MCRKLLLTLILTGLSGLRPAQGATDWQVEKGKHFLVHHVRNRALAERTLARAETLRREIAADLGFRKHGEFWLWDRRVRILIHPSRADFLRQHDAPAWAAGKANPSRREIATFAGSDRFFETVLPHELAHLVVLDFMGPDARLPLWLHEGIAQRAEARDRQALKRRVRELGRRGSLLGLSDLTALDVENIGQHGAAARFYEQAASLVDFLISVHGTSRFRRFCGHLRDRKPLEDALRFTYGGTLSTMAALEVAWKEYLEE